MLKCYKSFFLYLMQLMASFGEEGNATGLGWVNASPASYKDYPNAEKWLTLIYTLYIKYFRS